MSDYAAFATAGIPFLFYTVGRTVHYHAESDTPDTLNYLKMAAVSEHLISVVTAFSTRPAQDGGFDPDGADDIATIESLRTVLGHLVSDDAGQAALALDFLDELAVVAAVRDLDATEQSLLVSTVLRLESAMAG